ncbi:hypothetical protein ABZP36_027619 [Zizania latifolia]
MPSFDDAKCILEEVPSITLCTPVKPLAFVAPDTDEEVVLEDIRKGQVVSSEVANIIGTQIDRTKELEGIYTRKLHIDLIHVVCDIVVNPLDPDAVLTYSPFMSSYFILLQNPFTFPPYHKAVREPFDYYMFAEMKQFAKSDTSVLKQHYEKKLHEMEQEKKALQKEIEDLRHALTNISYYIDESSQQLKENYLQKLNTLESQASELKKKEEAQQQLLWQKQKSDDAANRLQEEIHHIKSQKEKTSLEWFANECKKFGCTLEFVTNKSEEVSQFCRGFDAIGGILRNGVLSY